MKREFVILVLILVFVSSAGGDELFDAEMLEFARRLDAKALSLTAVQYKGRVAIFDTPGREEFTKIYGRAPREVPLVVAHAEMLFNAGEYLTRPLIYVREKNMRAFISRRLGEDYESEFERTNRIRPVMLMDAEGLQDLLDRRRITVEQAGSALVHGRVGALRPLMARMGVMGEYRVAQNRLSERLWAFIAAGGNIGLMPTDREWTTAADLLTAAGEQGELARSLARAWRRRDAEAVNSLIGELRGVQRRLGQAGGVQMPSGAVRRLDYYYNRTYRGSMVFVGFAAALVIFAFAAGTSGPRARRAGMAVLGVSTAALLGGIIVRWVLSGRSWYLPPIMNQFESVAASAALGAVVALGIEFRSRRNYIALAAALYATVAMLFCFFMPDRMGAEISAKHGILNSPIMAAHVSVIIVGHALAGMALVISLIYVSAALVRRIVAPGRRAGAMDSIDACNLIVARLACWTVIAGTILGAWWADFAWGRWWGWDPKETWALITGIIFVATFHARAAAPAKHRAVVTAVGCILAGAAMLFNWVFVNYILTGLHNYT